MSQVYAYELGQYFTSLGPGSSGGAYTLVNGSPPAGGAGDAVGVGPIYHGNDTPKQLTWEVILSGSPATLTVNLEGSLDLVNWYQLDSTTTVQALQARSVVLKPFRYYRINVTVVTGAPAGTLIGRIFIG